MARVKEALADPEIQGWSSHKIADFIGASQPTVAKYRPVSTVKTLQLRTGADGRKRRVPTPDPAKEAEKAKEKAETAVANAKAKLAEKVVAAAALGIDTDAVEVEEAATVIRLT